MTSNEPYRMPSATAFLPSYISVFVNFETSLSLYFGSGMMRRFGTSLRRGMTVSFYERELGPPRLRGDETEDQALGRLTPYFERLRLRLALFVEDGPIAPD